MADTTEVVVEQPMIRRGNHPLNKPRFVAGSARSVGRLRHLNFDPIKELVDKYHELETEIARQKKIREGEIVELTATGKPKSYRPEVHHALYDKQISIGEKLLRYAYGRVPESNVDEQKPAMPLIVNLTKKGETYIANDVTEVHNEDDDADSH